MDRLSFPPASLPTFCLRSVSYLGVPRGKRCVPLTGGSLWPPPTEQGFHSPLFSPGLALCPEVQELLEGCELPDLPSSLLLPEDMALRNLPPLRAAHRRFNFDTDRLLLSTLEEVRQSSLTPQALVFEDSAAEQELRLGVGVGAGWHPFRPDTGRGPGCSFVTQWAVWACCRSWQDVHPQCLPL